MIVETILSPIKNETKEVEKASFWTECYHEDEVTPQMLKNGKDWYRYHVKFDGTKAIQITKTEKISG